MKNVNMQDIFSGAISALVIIGFFVILILSYFHPAPDNQMAQSFAGALTIAFGGVVNFWVGSSRSSQVKDATISQMASTANGNGTSTAPHVT